MQSDEYFDIFYCLEYNFFMKCREFMYHKCNHHTVLFDLFGNIVKWLTVDFLVEKLISFPLLTLYWF